MAILTSKGVKASHQLRGVRKVRISRDRRGAGSGEQAEIKSLDERMAELDERMTEAEDNIDDLYDSSAVIENLIKTSYYKQGKSQGNTPGFLLNGGIPRKIVAIGNSLTGIPNQYTMQDGTAVDESREYGATKSNKGWTNIVYTWLQNMYPSIDVNFYKALVRPWEDGTLGERTYDLISSQPVYRVETERTFNADTTLDDILDSEVDIIFLNAGENITGIDSSNVTDLRTDYVNLINSIKQKCPNAKIYVFGLWWKSKLKSKALLSACYLTEAQIIYNPAWSGYITENRYNYAALNHVAGDNYYKLNSEEVLGSYSEGSSANHPNDVGYLNRAILAIFNLMWCQCGRQLRFAPENTATIDNVEVTAIFNFNTANIRSITDIDTALDTARMPPGIYKCAFYYPYKSSGNITYKAAYVNVNITEDATGCYLIELVPFASDNATALSTVLKAQDSWIGNSSLEDYLDNY